MNISLVYSLLDDACRALDEAEDHAIAAYVGMAMALIEERYGAASDLGGADPDGADLGDTVRSDRRGGDMMTA